MYELIALDMDGTLLNSEKQISQGHLKAIQKALSHNKKVIFNTGRCPAELAEYFDLIPELQYLNCVSGALVYDRINQKVIAQERLSIDIVEQLLDISLKEDMMVHMLDQKSIIEKDKLEQMPKYHMGVYQDMYERVTTKVESLYHMYSDNPIPIAKINFYHTSSEARERTRQRILDYGLDVEMANAEETSLEISAKGVDKGKGLKELCTYLDIPLSQVIVVGDADNDREALKIAGLAVAMGNAIESIKEIADVVVSDNDHDGCQEVIEKYLL